MANPLLNATGLSKLATGMLEAGEELEAGLATGLPRMAAKGLDAGERSARGQLWDGTATGEVH